jgi:mannose-6-phosphate isomerase-like protein (cupin superfamily)
LNDSLFLRFIGDKGVKTPDDTRKYNLSKNGQVDLKSGEMFVVPKGTEHKPFAELECKVILVEPAGTVNTGDAGGDLTAKGDVWI